MLWDFFSLIKREGGGSTKSRPRDFKRHVCRLPKQELASAVEPPHRTLKIHIKTRLRPQKTVRRDPGPYSPDTYLYY